jgi:hypothetical protein
MKRWGRAGNPKIKKNIHLLGTMPDEEFAKLVGCHPQYPYFLVLIQAVLPTPISIGRLLSTFSARKKTEK